MGYLMVRTGVSQPGLADFPMLDAISRTTIIALTASFFVGGQELRRLLGKISHEADESVTYSREEVFLGTGRTYFVFIVRAFFVLLGLEALTRILLGTVPTGSLGRYYPLIAYLGLVISFILIDRKAVIQDKRKYMRKGVLETVVIVAVLLLAFKIAQAIRPVIALPQIFFVMLTASGLGALFYRWKHGPILRCLLFAGIPVVLAANFIIGGSRINEAFGLVGMRAVLAYGFFGQVFWMFGGIALLVAFGRTNAVRNLGPGMAGSLSHAGLTGACTAGDLGETAAHRAPIMINVPFLGHILVFSILAISVKQGGLLVLPTLVVVAAGLGITFLALRTMRRANGEDGAEVKALMQFSLGWQLMAVFFGLFLLHLSGMPIGHALMAKSSAISHFGLFAAIQGGMAGSEAAGMIAFVFAMPFLVHPLVFFMFGRAMESDGKMPRVAVYVLAAMGLAGMLGALLVA
jgi:hypothetical protein